jgi:hypothetical protein
VSDVVAVRRYARQRQIPPSTVFDAIAHGHIRQRAGGIDRSSADAWFEGYRQRAEQLRLDAPVRARSLEAQAVSLETEIQTLERELRELRGTTCRRADADAAYARRLERLHCALVALPLSYTGEASQALQRPPRQVYAVLTKFAQMMLRELPQLAARTAVGDP